MSIIPTLKMSEDMNMNDQIPMGQCLNPSCDNLLTEEEMEDGVCDACIENLIEEDEHI